MAASSTTQIGAPLAISGSAVSWALPAKTSSVIISASGTDRPLLTIATPVTRPQAAMPSDAAEMSLAPRRYSGWRVSADQVDQRLIARIVLWRRGDPRVSPGRRARPAPGGRGRCQRRRTLPLPAIELRTSVALPA